MIVYVKIIWIFFLTFYYFLISFLPGPSLLALKQRWAKKILQILNYQLFIQGQIDDYSEGLLLVGNHISFLDILVLLASHPNINFVAKKEVKNWPFIGPAADRAGTVFVDRENPLKNRQQIRLQMTEQMKNKKTYLAVFPSGTTTLYEEKKWKKGSFEIAIENKIKIKAFKIGYFPMRESAYIDDDSLLGQLKLILKIKNKKAYLNWLPEQNFDSAEAACAQIQSLVQNHQIKDLQI